jgi:multicomponent Na+:H+ antiporter subunit E
VTPSPADTAPSLFHYLLTFLFCLLLWMLLVGNLQRQELIAGGVVALVVTLAAGPRLWVLSGVRPSLSAPLHLLSYLAVFLVALVRANLDMARRVLSPSLPLRPAVVAVSTGLQSSLGRLLLANSITLTPGTLAVDVQEDRLLVHWVDCAPGADLQAATRAIAESFERPISGFLK